MNAPAAGFEGFESRCADLPAPMREALRLAWGALGRTHPNPAVGALIVGADGRPLGRGQTQPVGGAHAEVMALRDAAAQGHAVRGATAYVTLEPCAHQGRTGPCCDALIAAGIGRVVVSLQDPNPRVAGQGLARLRAAGVAVELGCGAAEAREINLGFLSRMTRGRPWVRVKAALSLDGRSALPDGRSQWITGAAARTDGHRWRARAGCILTGSGTMLADNPRLDVRLPGYDGPPPALVIVDSRLRTPPDAQALHIGGRGVWIACTAPTAAQDADAWQDRQHRLLQALAAALAPPPQTPYGHFLDLPAAARAHGQAPPAVDLAALLQALGAREVNELHVEAGPGLNGALARAGLVDEWLIYLAPLLIGPGRPLAEGPPLAALSDALRCDWQAVERVGDDLRLRLRPQAAPSP